MKQRILSSIVMLMIAVATILAKPMSKSKKEYLKQTVKEMFYHGYESYMLHAFPQDELSPLRCTGRGRDYLNPSNVGINDVLGDYSLTLIDSLDMLFIIGDYDEFFRAISLVEKHVDFTKNQNTVQVFESNIRILGGLLSAHLLASHYVPENVQHTYNGVLLRRAIDIADRLMPAFNSTKTGLPFPRVNLMHGVPKTEINQTCSAGAGTLLLEFGVLSRLTGNPKYETAARSALTNLWSRRSKLDLVGNVIDIQSGSWIEPDSGIGAGIDSLFEYQLKAYILFGDVQYLSDFQVAYSAIMKHILHPNGYIYQRVNMHSGALIAKWIDSLGAFFPGLQVLYGDIENAIKSWSIFDSLWNRYNGLPERFDFMSNSVVLGHYPLRPEHIESTFMLYQATRNPIFLEAGERFIIDFQRFTRKSCGFASISNVITKTNDDRMESFFLTETLKYLYLMFDEQNILNTIDGNLVFSTEAHPLLLPRHLLTNHDFSGLTCPKQTQSLDLFPKNSNLLSIIEGAKSILGLVGELPRTEHAICMKPEIDPLQTPFYVEFKPSLSNDSEIKFPKFEISLLDNGDYLVNHLHNVKLGLISTGTKGILISQIEGVKIPDKARVLCSQKFLKFVNQGSDFLVDKELNIVRFFKKTAVFLDNKVIKKLSRLEDHSDFYIDLPAQTSLFGYQPAILSTNDTKYPVEGPGYFDQENHLGCSKFNNELSGQIVIVSRGKCTFMEKAFYAYKSGAIGLIIINNDDSVLQMAHVDELMPYDYLLKHFYSVMIRRTDGDLLLKQLSSNSQHRISLFKPPPKHDYFGLNDILRSSSRTLLSIDDRTIENLIVLSETEYAMLDSPDDYTLYQYLDPPKSRVLHPGMDWSCLLMCKQSDFAVCCS